jgi:tripartite-type tricarboxylate transporter receptor subunit TctC
VAAAQLESMAGVNMLHVPYRGAAPAMQDVMAGRVAFTIDVITSSLPHVKGGKLKASAVTSAQRSPQAPDVPTVAEAGLPGYEFVAWYALLAPARTPPETLKRLGDALQHTLAQPGFVQRLKESGAQPMPMSQAASAAYLDRELDKWSRIVKERNIKAE